MSKIENTTKNNLITVSGIVLAFTGLGYLVGKGADKKVFAIGGAVVGLFVAPGIMSFIVKPKK